MKKKVLLIFSDLEKNKDFHHIPYSSLSLGALLENLDVDYEIIDTRVNKDYNLEAALKNVSIVGITIFTGYQIASSLGILKKIKIINKSIITIAGGPHATDLPAQTSKSDFIDFVVKGWAENTFPSLIEALITEEDVNKVMLPGVYRNGNETAKNSTHIVNKKQALNPLPFHKINIEDYINPKTKKVMYLTQYGCYGKCTFCSTPDTGKSKVRSLAVVEQDLSTLYNMFPFETFAFFDATLFYNKKRLFDLSLILDKYKNTKWTAYARANDISRYSVEDLKQIKNSGGGLSLIVLGLESGSTRVVEQIMKKGKGYLDHFAESIQKLKDACIPVLSGFIFGIPGETIEDLMCSIEYIKKIKEIDKDLCLGSSFFRPLPGTELYNLLENRGLINKMNSLSDWAELGESNHFLYNQWMDLPWLNKKETIAYKKAYDKFVDVHGDIMNSRKSKL